MFAHAYLSENLGFFTAVCVRDETELIPYCRICLQIAKWFSHIDLALSPCLLGWLARNGWNKLEGPKSKGEKL